MMTEELFYTLPTSGAVAEFVTMADTLDGLDLDAEQTFAPVPTMQGRTYARWGADDQLPYTLAQLVSEDEVTAQNKLFNIQTLYGHGLHYEGSAANAAAAAFAEEQNLPRFFLDQVSDMKYYYWAVCVLILSNDGRTIVSLHHYEAAYTRLERANAKTGNIDNAYYANWRGSRVRQVVRLPLLSERAPLADLRQRIARGDKQRKFGVLMRFPTVGSPYYPSPYYTAIFRSGAYEQKRLISGRQRTQLRNATSVKYQVEIHQDYWAQIMREERITDPMEQHERRQAEKRRIAEFLTNVENRGKVWISGYYVDPNGREQRMVRIYNHEGAKEGGDWREDLQAATNALCYADGIHPTLVGAVPGKAQQISSGSEKAELMRLKQALESGAIALLLTPHKLVCAYNGWADVKPAVRPIVTETTPTPTTPKTA